MGLGRQGYYKAYDDDEDEEDKHVLGVRKSISLHVHTKRCVLLSTTVCVDSMVPIKMRFHVMNRTHIMLHP